MFIGHFAVGFAAKKAAPKTSLGTLFIAVQFLDLLWPILVLAGVEHFRISPGDTASTPLDFYDYPFSHSLLTTLVWSLIVGMIYYAVRKNGRAAIVLALCVASHWLLDFITHRADLPLAPGMPARFGLGLWNSFTLSLVSELALFAVGVWTYISSTGSRDRKGTILLWALVAFLLLIHLANMFGPPPPSERVVAVSANAVWLIVLWGYWVDRHRAARTSM